jgi:adenosylcobyric acid synthase
MTPAVMFQGTGSDVGKSLVVAGLARAFTRRGLAVRPFKPQNMSNNAGVTADGGEIGRAQMLQARACGVAPSIHMNPVLLKPQSEKGAQVVVQGRVAGAAQARDYHAMKPTLMAAVRDSFARVAGEADLVLVEGAGSPAEVNLRAGDIANMGFALAEGVPVVLVGDIERGGVIASIVGTMALLEDDERATVAAYLINKFRGDVTLFDDAIAILRARTGLDCLGVVPHLAAARRLPAEDAMALDSHGSLSAGDARAIKVAVPRLERIANFDDLDPLVAEPDVVVILVRPGEAIPGDADLVLLPGSKSTMSDLRGLKANGWHVDIAAHVRRGGAVVGLCGGYQMLGRRVADPDGIEGPAGEEEGLGLLDVTTVLSGEKRLVAATGTAANGEAVAGYEMHMGVTQGADRARPMLRLDGADEGAVSADGRVMGSYLHGLFASDAFRTAFLGRLRTRQSSGIAFEAGVEAALDELAAGLEAALDLDRILEIARAR